MDIINQKPVSEIQKEKSEQEQRIDSLEKENALLKGCVMELADIVYSSTTATSTTGNGV